MDEETFAFGSFRLIPAQRVLLEDGEPLRLGSRALDILVTLVERAGETIHKDQLIARTWPDWSTRGLCGPMSPRYARHLVTARRASATSPTSRAGATALSRRWRANSGSQQPPRRTERSCAAICRRR